MSRKSVSRVSRTPRPVYNNLPPLSKSRVQSETPTHLNSDLNIYTYTNDNSYNLNTVRKFFTPTNAPKTSVPAASRLDMDAQLETFCKSKPEASAWEISERIESYQIKISLSPMEISTKEEFSIWKQCTEEILPMVKKFNYEIGTAMVVVTNKLMDLFAVTQKEADRINKKLLEDNSESLRKIKALEEESVKMKGIIHGLQETKRLEMDQISKEIAEIFGGEENELQLLKLKAKRFQDLPNSGTVEFLRDLCGKMSKEFDIPESKIHDLPAMNVDDFSKAINSKFRILQKSTASRVYKLLETTKPKQTVFVQTSAAYINPKDHEDLTAHCEKLTLQYQSALMQLDKAKEDLTNKSTMVDSLEADKTVNVSENTKLKREVDSLNKELAGNRKDTEGFRANLAAIKSGGDTKAKTITELEVLTVTQNNKILTLSKTIEKHESNIKEKEDRIKKLEEKLEKRRLTKVDKPEGEKSGLLSSTKPKPDKQPEPAFDHDRFDDMIKPMHKRGGSKIKSSATVFFNQDSKPSLQESFEEPITPIITLKNPSKTQAPQDFNPQKSLPPQDFKSSNNLSPQDFNPPRSQIPQEFSPASRNGSSFTSDSFQRNPTESTLPTRGTSRDTPLTRDTPLARVDEYKEIKDPKDLRETRDSRAQKDPDIEKSRIRKQDRLSANEGRNTLVQKSSESRETDTDRHPRKKSKNTMHYDESEEEYQINRSSQWGIGRPQLTPSEFEGGESRVFLGKDGKEYSVVDRCVWTTDDLKSAHVAECSKSTQASEGLLESTDSKASFGRSIYFLPYNPNNTYGLKGDCYFNARHNVFQAQPKIPDLANSVFFQTPYALEKEREQRRDLNGGYF